VKRMGALMVIVAALGAGPGLAQEPEKLEPVVVTATKIETPQEQLGASVTVITEEELRTWNHDEVHEALRQVPGVEVQRSGGLGKTTSIRIRGASPNQVQILVDGMRIKSPTLGEADLSELSLDAVDRIEVIRGPQSGLYGADAIGGVVNIITKKGEGPPRGFVHLEGGSYETFRERVGVQGAWGPFNFNLSGSRYDQDGQFPNDDSEQTAFGGRLGYDFPWRGELALSGRYSKTNLDLPVHDTQPFVLDPNAQQQTETWLFNLAYTQKLVDGWDVKARYGQWANNQGFQDAPPPPPPPLPPGAFDDIVISSQINTRRLEAEALNIVRVAPWNTVTAGAEFRSEVGRSRGTFREEINTTSVLLQDDLRVLERFFLNGSLRWDDNDAFGDELTGRIGATLAIKESGTRLRGTWGTGFRAPTINDLFFPDLTGGLCPPFGNVDLKPERSRSWDAGVDQRVWQDRLRLGVTYFRNDFEDLITIVGVSPTPAGLALGLGPTDCAQSANVGTAHTEGVEFSSEVEPLEWILLTASYTFTDTEDETTGRELPRFARHRWSAGITLSPLPRLSLFTQVHVVSSQFDAVAARHNPGWHRIDMGGTYRLWGRAGAMEWLDFTARIENVTDETYDEVFGFRALGFNALVGLRASFQ
jgi:vitamin B12 transporter